MEELEDLRAAAHEAYVTAVRASMRVYAAEVSHELGLDSARYEAEPTLQQSDVAPIPHELRAALVGSLLATSGRDVPQVTAEVDLQRWVFDYANHVGTARFDCGPALETIPAADLPRDADEILAGALNFGDDIFHSAVHLGIVPDHDGPFEVNVDPEEYGRYLEARLEREGLTEPDRAEAPSER